MRRTALFSLLLMVGLAAVGGTAVLAVDDARVTIGEATVEPESPVVGAPTTIDVTLDLSGGSTEAGDLQHVVLLDEDDTELANVSTLGTLSPGDSLTVPVTTVFDEPGYKELTIVAEAKSESDDTVEVTRPLSIVVEDAQPMIDVEPIDNTVVGTETTVELSVSNPLDDPIRNVGLTLEDGDAIISPASRSIPVLEPGATETVTATIEPTTVGDRTLEVALTYVLGSGATATTERTVGYEGTELVADLGVQIRELPDASTEEDDADVDLGGIDIGGLFGAGGPPADNPDGNTEEQSPQTGGGDDLAVVVTNFGNAPVTNVVITPGTEDGTLPRLSIPGAIEPGESASVGVDLGAATDHPVTFEATYETAGVNATERIRYQPMIDRGEVAVTGIDVEVVGDRASISGNVGNPTASDISGVVVAVNGSEFVEPTYPQRDYFVGTLEGGEFAPFDLTASVDAENATEIGLDVTYRTDVGPESQLLDLPIEAQEPTTERDGSGTLVQPLSLIAIAIVGVAIAAVVYLRRQGTIGSGE